MRPGRRGVAASEPLGSTKLALGCKQQLRGITPKSPFVQPDACTFGWRAAVPVMEARDTGDIARHIQKALLLGIAPAGVSSDRLFARFAARMGGAEAVPHCDKEPFLCLAPRLIDICNAWVTRNL